jgi:threonine/homoserine/homoserine lactone efflux protein
MPSLETLITFTIICVLLGLSPGPSNLYVMARSVAQGLQAGMVAAFGLATGGLVHVLAAVLGLSVLFTTMPVLYTDVKLVGAAYLIWLGISSWRKHDAVNPAGTRSGLKSPGRIYRESIIVEITNPKTALFFIALLPQFVDPALGPVSWQLLVLGVVITLTAIPCDLLVALFSSQAARWLAHTSMHYCGKSACPAAF